MQTLPQPAEISGEARPVSEILARADPADMPAMRAGLSFLTSAGAELAVALEKSNQENQRLTAIISALPPEWVDAATTGAAFPDIGSLRAEVEVLKNECIDLHGQLVERDQIIEALNVQIAQFQAEQATRSAAAMPEAEIQPTGDASVEAAALAARLEELQAELDSVALERAEAEDHLRASEADLSDIDSHLASLRADLLAALPEEKQAELAATPGDDQTADERQRRAMRLGALAAAISSVVDHSKQNDALVVEMGVSQAAAQEQLEIANSAKLALEADLQEKINTLDDLQAQLEQLHAQNEALNEQIEQLNDQTAALQGELETALAAKAQLEEQLLAREGELAELNQQIDSVAQQLRLVLPEDTLAQLTPAEEPGEEAALSEEGEADVLSAEGEETTRSAGQKMLGLGAIAAGVAAAVDLSQQKAGEAEQASGQLAAVVDEKTSLESALHEREEAIAQLSGQIDALNLQVADMQAQIDATLATKTELEQQLEERTGQVNDLQSQIDEATSRLREFVPDEDLPQAEAPVEGAEEGAEEGGEEAVAVKAVGLAALVGGAAHLVDRRQNSIAELDGSVQTLQAELDGLREEKSGLEALLDEKVQELAGYNDYSLNLQGQVNALAAERSALEADLQIRMASQAEVEAQVESLTAQVQELTAQVGDLQAQLDAATAAKAEVEQALQASQEQLNAAQADLAAIEAEAEQALGDDARGLGAVAAGAAAVASIREKDADLAAANEQLSALQGQLDALEAERADLALSKEELLASLQSREAELADLTAQLDALQMQVTGIAGERGALQEHVVELEGTLSDIEAQRSAPLALASALTEALANKPAFKARAASAAIVAGVDPVLGPAVQALTDVKGIGSAYQQRLYNAGVGTYWELANLPAADMQDFLQIPALQRPRFDAEQTRIDAYQWAQETETVGLLWDGDHVDDFESLPGIGKTFEKRLYEAGITTYEQLAACDVQRLAEIVRAPAMQEVSYDQWIEQANQLLAARRAEQAAAQDQPEGDAE